MDDQLPTILFAGGGTGGHLFPGLAIAERLRSRPEPPAVHFACSNRLIDETILGKADVPFTPLPVKPLPRMPFAWPMFLGRYMVAKRWARRLIDRLDVGCIVAMGGFVSGPVVTAARGLGVPVMLVNLDAVPGKANRWLAGKADRVFSVYPEAPLPVERVEPTPMPLRYASVGPEDATAAKGLLGFDEFRPLLLITGASQGSESINNLMIELIGRPQFRETIAEWQVLHLAGPGRATPVQQAYLDHGIEGTVMPFHDRMGLAWAAADMAISRGGAGSVAEVIANAVPTVFLPYPHHKDEHQKHNVQHLVDAGAAEIFPDQVDPEANADQLEMPLLELITDGPRRRRMRELLRGMHQGDGAKLLADAAMELVGRSDEAT